MDRGAWWAAIHGVAQSQKRLKRLMMHACAGAGNGNPLQYYCLENPRDGGAWWAAVCGVAQSDRLKRLSSSSTVPEEGVMGTPDLLAKSERNRGNLGPTSDWIRK